MDRGTTGADIDRRLSSLRHLLVLFPVALPGGKSSSGAAGCRARPDGTGTPCRHDAERGLRDRSQTTFRADLSVVISGEVSAQPESSRAYATTADRHRRGNRTYRPDPEASKRTRAVRLRQG